MTTYIQRCLIASAAYARPASDLCAGMSGTAGSGMFITGGCSPDGALPATHFINEGMIDADMASLLPLTTFDADGVPTTIPGQPEVIVQIATSKGVPVTLAQINAVLAGVQVTQEAPQQARDRLGLVTIQEAL